MRIEGDRLSALNEFLSSVDAPTLTSDDEITFFTRVHLHGTMFHSSRYWVHLLHLITVI